MAQLDGINSGGIVTLGDGTRWRVAPGDLPMARVWPAGSEVDITENEQVGALWSYVLINHSNGERVRALPSGNPS